MSPDLKREAIRRLLKARRLMEAAIDHYEAGDEFMAEARHLVDEAKDLEAGIQPLPRPVAAVPVEPLH
ncbi:hypothetical protein [Enterovirga rhinocerotis]|uniref:Uncharacterized protein n=1 Tax=Enterovirga rhinocerotis TaxID=1339210 RepID=A0A4R7CEL0_9HYPH|nr:hypothetical protein [Enterovirga rhinocerotis]TDR95320.1 hypothetical protein EV668_0093 [Enterovirga rhinocerotis]